MSSLNNIHIARILGQHIGQQTVSPEGVALGTLVGVWLLHAFTNLATSSPDERRWLHGQVRLVLRPLSAFSDTDALWLANTFGGYEKSDFGGKSQSEINEYLTGIGKAMFRNREFSAPLSAHYFQFLIQRGYAVPLFIAPGHPDNGKTAIELGLAVDATTISA